MNSSVTFFSSRDAIPLGDSWLTSSGIVTSPDLTDSLRYVRFVTTGVVSKSLDGDGCFESPLTALIG